MGMYVSMSLLSVELAAFAFYVYYSTLVDSSVHLSWLPYHCMAFGELSMI